MPQLRLPFVTLEAWTVSRDNLDETGYEIVHTPDPKDLEVQPARISGLSRVELSELSRVLQAFFILDPADWRRG